MDIVIRDDATTPGALLRTRLEELRNSSAPREALVQAMNTTCGALVGQGLAGLPACAHAQVHTHAHTHASKHAHT